VFAIEAKLAWFSPEGSARAQISATKLQPGESAKLIVQALDSPSNATHLTPEAPLLLTFTILLLATFRVRRPSPDHLSVETQCSFSPPVFFRPPPRF
jgi:hypothetical protein